MIDPTKDGIDHINIYSRGRTFLGRQLSNFARTPFDHPEDGRFASVEGYWYWLSCFDDALRDVSGYRAKQMGRELGGTDWLETEQFKEKILLALQAKYEKHTYLQDLLNKNSLPFEHYYVFANGHVVEPKEGKWILKFWESK